jgi:hypothetical protein
MQGKVIPVKCKASQILNSLIGTKGMKKLIKFMCSKLY